MGMSAPKTQTGQQASDSPLMSNFSLTTKHKAVKPLSIKVASCRASQSQGTSHSCRAGAPATCPPSTPACRVPPASTKTPPPPPLITPFPAPLPHSGHSALPTRAKRHRSHGTRRLPRRRSRGVPPPRARRLRRGGGLAPLPRPGAGGGLHRGRRGPGRLPHLRVPGEHGEEPVQDLLRGGQDRRGQPRRRRLPLLLRGQQEPEPSHRHEARLHAPRRLRLVQHRLQQVPHFRGSSCRSTWSVCGRINERRSAPAESRRELSDDDGDRPRGRRGGSAARLLLPPLSGEDTFRACCAALAD